MKRIPPPILLLLIAVAAYGLLIPQLGFYWDDLPMSWIRYQLGAEAMTRYFSTNRPVWALLYQITTHLFPQQPVYWQVFALFWRWAGAFVFFLIFKKLFPKNERLAFAAAVLFLLYPGFNQQWASYLYSHFFIVIFFFLFSYDLTLRGKTIPALIFSALNLWMMEYFFVLELARPFVIFASLREESSPFNARILKTLKLSSPYLGLFALAVWSRLFVFNNQVYQIGLNAEEAAPAQTLLETTQSALAALWTTTVSAWAQVFQLPRPAADGIRTTGLYAFVVLSCGALTLFALRNQTEGEKRRADSLWALGLGFVFLLLAGPPFWLTGVPVSLGFPANRATLSFLFGASLILAGLISLPPPKFKYVLTLFVALAAGRQFLWSNDFRRDWNEQKNLFWQMTWRAPGLQENTIVLTNEELEYYADNSLAAALNWIYDPQNRGERIHYVLFYPTNRRALSLQPETPLEYDFLAGKFHGNTSQTVAFYYAPPKCLRLLDPEIDSVNRMIPDDSLLRDAALLSSAEWILPQARAVLPPPYQPEPSHGWCYYFQKADLARQKKDWEEVTRLGAIAFALDDFPNDPVERFVFIEGYAHVGEWEKALELSRTSYKVSRRYVGPLLCRLWARIARQTFAPNVTLNQVQKEFECKP